MDENLTVKKAATIIGVTSQTLRNWEKEGTFVPYRNPINNYRIYKRSQVNSFIRNMEEERKRTGRFKLRVQTDR